MSTSAAARKPSGVSRRFKKGAVSFLWACGGVALAIVFWELIKLLSRWITFPFDTSDQAMPNIWTIVAQFGQPEVRGSETTVFQAVAKAAGFSLLVAFGGFVIGVAIGLLLAIIMQRFWFLERGLLPFVIASQTVPLIALAPLVVGIGNKISIGPIQWNTTYSTMCIAAYLAFFPLSVGALRGLQAPTAAHLELMRAFNAAPRQELWKLRFPASVPYLVPALKVSAAAAVVGTVVAEISTGVKGGIGRLILEYARETTTTPAKVYVAVIGALVLGLIVAGLVALFDLYITRNLPKESAA